MTTAPKVGIAWLPLLSAIAIMIVLSIYPAILAGPDGKANHSAAYALFWAMSAGFVRGVGFIPRHVVWRYMFSGSACAVGLLVAIFLQYRNSVGL